MTLPRAADRLLSDAARADYNAFRALIRTFGLLERVMNPYFASFGISGAQWGMLRCLYRAQEKGEDFVTVTELSQQLLIRPPSVTGLLDRLVRDGLVKRQARASDMRVRQISLTPKGRRVVEKVFQAHPAQIARVMGGLEDRQQQQLLDLLHTLEQHLQELLQSEGL